MIATRADPVVTCWNWGRERQLSGKELGGGLLGEMGRGGLCEFSNRVGLRDSLRRRSNCTVHAAREARWALGCQPRAASSGVEAAEAGQARAGAETQRFFWELVEAGSRREDLRSPQRPRPRVRDAGEVTAAGDRGWPRADTLTCGGRARLGEEGGGTRADTSRSLSAQVGWTDLQGMRRTLP